MPYGTGPLVRQALERASPWQRYLIAAAMVAAGAFLLALGHIAGGVLSLGGILILWRMVRYKFQGRRASP